jgi:hypothetical protein
MNKYRLLPEITKLPVESIIGNSFVVGSINFPSTFRLPLMYAEPVNTNKSPFNVVSPFIVVLPVTTTDPVNWCVSSNVSPNFEDPDTSSV